MDVRNVGHNVNKLPQSQALLKCSSTTGLIGWLLEFYVLATSKVVTMTEAI